jgi:predicted nucleic acid-binding protein
MNLIVLDADGLIKLGKVGLLPYLAESYNCIISEQVFRDAIEEGKKHFYEDVFVLEGYINQQLVKVVTIKPSAKAKKILHKTWSLGEGEKSTLHLFYNQNALGIVSDDVAFLNLLDRHSVPYFTPANLISRLVELKKISRQQGLTILEKLKPYIRNSIYKLVKKEMEVE